MAGQVTLVGNCMAMLWRASPPWSHLPFCSEGAGTSLQGSEARVRQWKFRHAPMPAAHRCASEEGCGRERCVQTRHRLCTRLGEGRTQKTPSLHLRDASQTRFPGWGASHPQSTTSEHAPRYRPLCMGRLTAGVFPRVHPFSLQVHSMYPV